jgi:hypothetical protein
LLVDLNEAHHHAEGDLQAQASERASQAILNALEDDLMRTKPAPLFLNREHELATW